MRRIANLAVAMLLLAMVPPTIAQPMREKYQRPMQEPRPMHDRQGMRGMAEELDDDGGPASAAPLPPGTRVERDLAYGSDPAQRLDVYLPQHAENAPVIFMVHGGGWQRGDKAASKVVRNKVAHWLPKGYVMVMPNYRLSPQADPIEQANDVAKALAFAQSKAKEWHADPSRFVLMGHSAGAHLVSLISADPTIATRLGAKRWLGTVALDSAGFNIVEIMESRHFRLYDRVFGNDRRLWRDASPLARLTSAPVPMLLVCSSKRADSCPQARAFAEKATSLGGNMRVLPIDLRHAEINEMLGSGGEYTRDVDRFLASLGLK